MGRGSSAGSRGRRILIREVEESGVPRACLLWPAILKGCGVFNEMFNGLIDGMCKVKFNRAFHGMCEAMFNRAFDGMCEAMFNQAFDDMMICVKK